MIPPTFFNGVSKAGATRSSVRILARLVSEAFKMASWRKEYIARRARSGCSTRVCVSTQLVKSSACAKFARSCAEGSLVEHVEISSDDSKLSLDEGEVLFV